MVLVFLPLLLVVLAMILYVMVGIMIWTGDQIRRSEWWQQRIRGAS